MLFHNPSRNFEARDVPVNFSRSCFLFLSSISCNPVLAFLFFDPPDAEAAGFSAWAGCVMVLVGGGCGCGTDRGFSICVIGDLRIGFCRLPSEGFGRQPRPLPERGTINETKRPAGFLQDNSRGPGFINIVCASEIPLQKEVLATLFPK